MVVEDGKYTYFASERHCVDFGEIAMGDSVTFVGRRGNRPDYRLARKVVRDES